MGQGIFVAERWPVPRFVRVKIGGHLKIEFHFVVQQICGIGIADTTGSCGRRNGGRGHFSFKVVPTELYVFIPWNTFFNFLCSSQKTKKKQASYENYLTQ